MRFFLVPDLSSDKLQTSGGRLLYYYYYYYYPYHHVFIAANKKEKCYHYTISEDRYIFVDYKLHIYHYYLTTILS